MSKRSSLLMLSHLVGTLLLTGCEQEGPAERAGKELDRAIEEFRDSSAGARDDVRRSLDDAGEQVKEALTDAGDEMKEALDDARRELDRALESAREELEGEG